jgi:hypothetical protein
MINKTTSIFALIMLMAFQACQGPIGPEGPQGEQGEPGVNILGTTYEVEVDFTAANEYTDVFNFPTRLEDSDGVLIYRLVGTEGNRDIWRQLPQTYFFQEGVLMYNFDFTVTDFAIFLDGPINYQNLANQWRIDQVFRVIVIPSDFPRNRIDFSDYEAVTQWLGIKEDDFQKGLLKRKN